MISKADDNQEKIQTLLKTVEDGIKVVFESERYKKYLSTMSKFHDYSFRNIFLILSQKPDATRVAGFVAWQEKFGRSVCKGEKGISIIGYAPKKITEEVPKKDPITGRSLTDATGKAITESVTKQIPYFKQVYVFDVSQTEGEPLPAIVEDLSGNVKGYENLVTALKDISVFSIHFEDIQGNVKGRCDYMEKKITIKQGMSEAQTVKTIIHEITHTDLHSPSLNLTMKEITDRQTKEVEALCP